MKSTSTIRFYLALVTLITGYLGGPSDSLAQVGDVTLYEGATLIVGDGSSIENSAFIVQNGRFSRVGSSGDIEAPAGAVRIDLTGKTVMPRPLVTMCFSVSNELPSTGASPLAACSLTASARPGQASSTWSRKQ